MTARSAAIVLLLISILAPSVRAQDKTRDVRVGVIIAPPFVTEDGGALDGFSIELWNAVAAQMKATTSYQVLPDVEALQEALRQKKVDAVVSPLVITLDRVENFDCSVPILQVGLQIMVRSNGVPVVSPQPLEEELDLIFSRTAFIWLGIALILVLVPAHLVWLLDRYEEDGIITSSSYVPGIFQAMYWALACLTTQAEKMPHHWLARIVALFWMFTGVAFVASYTAQLTSTLTVRQFTNSIQGPEDLPGREVGTVANSYAVRYLQAHNVRVQTFDKRDEMFQALLDKRVDAVVWESPILRYYVLHQGQGRVILVGRVFYSGPVSFMLPPDSPLRRQIDIALLALRDNGTYEQLHTKWFGEL